MEREAIRKYIYIMAESDMSRFADDILRDIASEVSIPEKVGSWIKENISESVIRKMVDEIMKDAKLREKWMTEYKTCMKHLGWHEYCVDIASSSVVRDYLSSEEVLKKLLEWVGKYLKEKVPPLISIRVESEKELISETRAL